MGVLKVVGCDSLCLFLFLFLSWLVFKILKRVGKKEVKTRPVHFELNTPAPLEAVKEEGTELVVFYGHYKQPLLNPNLSLCKPLGLLSPLRLKQWSYHHLTTSDHFVCFVVAHMGYAGLAWFFVLDKKTRTKYLYRSLGPKKRIAHFATSSVEGKTEWREGENHLSVAYENGQWVASIAVTVKSELDKADQKRVQGSIIMKEGPECMAMLFNLAHDRPAYTHKAAGLLTSGQISLGGVEISMEGALASLDWTRAYANRVTEWYWSNFAGFLTDGRKFGANFSSKVYGDKENAIWVDDKVFSVGYIHYTIPPEGIPLEQQVWKVQSNKTSESITVELEFRPIKKEGKEENLLVVYDRFTQCYGYYSGFVIAGEEKLEIENFFGVAEDHYAKW